MSDQPINRPPLPFRRLKAYANGIWDEDRRTFYPFKVSQTTVSAKPGVHYYLHGLQAVVSNWGDQGLGYSRLTITQNGSTYVFSAWCSQTSAALLPGSEGQCSVTGVGMLCDPGTALTYAYSGTAKQISILYAEIPVDVGWSP